MKRNERGFMQFTEFKDSKGQDVRVQQSSAVGDFVWIFCSKNGEDGTMHLGKLLSYSPHLTKAQARRVAKALMRFAGEPKKRKARK